MQNCYIYRIVTTQQENSSKYLIGCGFCNMCESDGGNKIFGPAVNNLEGRWIFPSPFL